MQAWRNLFPAHDPAEWLHARVQHMMARAGQGVDASTDYASVASGEAPRSSDRRSSSKRKGRHPNGSSSNETDRGGHGGRAEEDDSSLVWKVQVREPRRESLTLCVATRMVYARGGEGQARKVDKKAAKLKMTTGLQLVRDCLLAAGGGAAARDAVECEAGYCAVCGRPADGQPDRAE